MAPTENIEATERASRRARPPVAPQTGAAARIGAERLRSYHEYARTKGVNPVVYIIGRLVIQLPLLVYFRLSRVGREHARVAGPLIVAANHRSLLDGFLVASALPWRRSIHAVAKIELFERRWLGWLISRMGAYPVDRGSADADAIETSRGILERGGAVIIFPEGTRIRSGSLATPHRGGGRLALESGAAVLPVAIFGSEDVRRAWRIRPRKVKLRVGRPMRFPRTENPSHALAAIVTDRIWPNVELQWEWLGGLPQMRNAAVVGAGSWGTGIAVLLGRGGLEVQLGCRTAEQAAELAAAKENRRYLSGVELGERLAIKRAADIEIGGLDLVCLAVPAASLPAAIAALGDRVGSRSSVLLLSKGLVPPLGMLPSAYVGERVRARAIASLGGPAHAREAVAGTAALVLGSGDADLRAQLGDVFDRAGFSCELTDDVVGVEMAGVAKNAAALAAAAAEPHGMNAAGIAAAEIWRECVDYAISQGARLETFSGLAGVGDLTATVMAPGSRNRRAGELLGAGTPAYEIRAEIGQASEALDSVPLIASTVAQAGVGAEGLDDLAALIAGEIAPDEWVARLRRVERARAAA